MSETYYLHRNICSCCGRSDDPIEIGVSSFGWVFSLTTYDRESFRALDIKEWEDHFRSEGNKIVDEYDHVISADEMMSFITERSRPEVSEKAPFGYASWGEFHAAHCSEFSPNNLLRGRGARHGSGSYDYYPENGHE